MKYTYLLFALVGAIGLLQPTYANAQVRMEFRPHCTSFDSQFDEFAPAFDYMIDITKGGIKCGKFSAKNPSTLHIDGVEIDDELKVDVVLTNTAQLDVKAAAAMIEFDSDVLAISDLVIDKDYFAEVTPGGQLIDSTTNTITIIANTDSTQNNKDTLLRVATFTATVLSTEGTSTTLRFTGYDDGTTGAYDSLDASSDNLVSAAPAELEISFSAKAAADDELDDFEFDEDIVDGDFEDDVTSVNPFADLTAEEIANLLGTMSATELLDAFTNMTSEAVDSLVDTLDAAGASALVQALKNAPGTALAFIQQASANGLDAFLQLLNTEELLEFLDNLTDEALGILLNKLPPSVVESLLNSLDEETRVALLSRLSEKDRVALLERVDATIAEQWQNELDGTTDSSASSEQTLRNIGEACTESSECLSNNCTDSVCGTAGTSIPNGESCIVDFQCASFYCNEGICSDMINTTTSSSSTAATTNTPASNVAFGLLQVQNVRLTSDDTAAYIAWDRLSSSQVQGYTVYYGTVRSQYIQRKTVPQSETSLTIRNLPKGVQYFFSVKAVNSAGDETAFSPEVSVVIGNPDSSTSPLTANILSGGSSNQNSDTLHGETGLSSTIALSAIGIAVLATVIGFGRKRRILTTA